jgi:XTP/dITP diphosphohydrolase
VKETLLVATRSSHKLREVSDILAEFSGFSLLTLADLLLPASPDEDGLEAFSTFAENAHAKARYFAGRTGTLTLADDSGLCVDALAGAPGVRSKRFSGRSDLEGDRLDEANNELLLRRMADVPSGKRTAKYVCAAAIVDPQGREVVFEGSCAGEILPAPVGAKGFGYDPLFYVPEEAKSFGEMTAPRKNVLSHRARAVRLAASYLSRG